MLDFSHDHRPQHAHLDELEVRWGAGRDRFEFAIVRRMQRAGQPEALLSLVFGFALTPARQGHGSTPIVSLRDATSTEGYRAIARAAIADRELD
ncbi:MAG: hypothetical protein JWP85_1401 [Rhodoglobus sp.]|nr:hypothetical protein [Rhodoglobus sp.]